MIKTYGKLLKEFGDPKNYWPQWCAKEKGITEREKIIIGMILVQRTSWHNANIALKNLRANDLLSTAKIAKFRSPKKLIPYIRSAGFYQSKPQRIFDVCRLVVQSGGIKSLMKKPDAKVREELLLIKGVGQETADTILLYPLDKPIFIIDEYTRRWTERMDLTKEKRYEKLQSFFHENLKRDLKIYRNFHALIIISQRGREKSKMEYV